MSLPPGVFEAELREADRLAQEGRLHEARDVLERLCERRPDDPRLHFNRGNAHFRLADFEAAAAAYDAALRAAPGFAPAAENLGAALTSLGRKDAAASAYLRAFGLNPARSEPGILAAGLLLELDRVGEAERAARAVLVRAPNSFGARLALSVALGRQGEAEAAAKLLFRLREERPDDLSVLTALAAALRRLGGTREAVSVCEAALAKDPDRARGFARLGSALKDDGRFEEAVETLSVALERAPERPDAWIDRGAAKIEQGLLEEGLADLRRALELAPGEPDAWGNLGAGLFLSGAVDAAVEAYERALALKGSPEHRYGLGLALLKQGRFEEGWPAFEARLEIRGPNRFDRGRKAPRWDGRSRPDKVLLLETEQGLGDAIQCLRFVPLAAERTSKVLLRVQDPLAALCRSLPGVGQVLREDEPAAFDLQASLLSLPALFRASPETTPRPPYLAPDPERATWWRRQLPKSGLNVGLVWQGNMAARGDARRSIPLRSLRPLFGVEGVALISLQIGEGLAQLADAPEAAAVRRPGIAYEGGDLSEAAALIANLDLVISCDSALAHLAGALDRPVWLALQNVADWRWLYRGAQTFWYPSTRLYRQERAGDWEAVADALARDLEVFVRRREDQRAGATIADDGF